MSENGRETLSGWSLFGSAARLRDSNAIIRSTHPAGRRALNSEMNSAPKISSRSRSNSRSIPTHRKHDDDIAAHYPGGPGFYIPRPDVH